MPKRKPTFHLSAYYPRKAMTREAFARFWAQMARAPFEARKYDDVERMKLAFSPDGESRAYRKLELGLLMVRGKGLAYFVQDRSSIDRLMFQMEPGSMGERSREQWLSWFVDLFDILSVVFAFGCLETEFDAKHTISFQGPDGGWQSDDSGFRPNDFKAALPGVYWLNYYGSEIGEHLGERIAKNDDMVVTELSRNRFLAMLKEPLTPTDLDARLVLERKIAADIGPDYFFDKQSPSSKKRQVPGLAALFGSA